MHWSDRIGRRIKLRDLHVLHAVVQLGSMTKAASNLAISVPVVSKAIAELEHTVGVPLLDRSPQGVEPTAYGRALVLRGLAAFEELRQGMKDIESIADPATGEVRIASTAPLAASFVCAVIDRLARRYPRIVFVPTVANDGNIRRLLSERNVDLTIARQFAGDPDEPLNFEVLYDNPYVVMAGADSPWVRKRKVALADLMDEPWVLPPPDSMIGRFFAEGFRAQGLALPNAAVIAYAYEVRVSLLATNRYLTILPESVLRFPAANARVKIVPADLRLRRAPIGIFTLKSRTIGPAAQLFMEAAREIARPLATSKR
jgi:DNA-binding transcriptional LysR family regulator